MQGILWGSPAALKVISGIYIEQLIDVTCLTVVLF